MVVAVVVVVTAGPVWPKKRMHWPFLRQVRRWIVAVGKTGFVAPSYLVETFAVVSATLEGLDRAHGRTSHRMIGQDTAHYRRHPNRDGTFGGVPSAVEIAEDNAVDIRGTAAAVVVVVAGVVVENKGRMHRAPNQLAFVGVLPVHWVVGENRTSVVVVVVVAVGIAVGCSQDNVENVRNHRSADFVVVVVVVVAVAVTRDLTCPFVVATRMATVEPC